MADVPHWSAALPEDLRGEPMFKDIPDVPTLAKVARDAKSALGGSLRIPGPDASEEARTEFRAKLRERVPELVPSSDESALWAVLGKPKDAKEYALEGIELDPGVTLDEGEARAFAAKLGLTRGQFKVFAKDVLGASKAAELRTAKEADTALRKEWGQAYEERSVAAKAMALKLGVPEAAIIGMPAAQLRVFANVAKAVGGEGRQVGDQGPGAGRLTPQEAKHRMAEIRARPEYFGGSNPALSKELAAKHQELAEIAWGNGA